MQENIICPFCKRDDLFVHDDVYVEYQNDIGYEEGKYLVCESCRNEFVIITKE